MDRIVSLFLLILTPLAIWIWKSIRPKLTLRVSKEESLDDKPAFPPDPYQDIEPLDDFEWSTTPPIKQRPFKPKYHLTMSLENMPLSELIAMDNTYLDRANLRQSIIDQHLDSTVQCNPTAEAAVTELYQWMFGTYLPKRFPRTFQIIPPTSHPDAKSDDAQLFNSARRLSIPLTPPSALSALRTLGENIDTDFLFLLPSPASAADGSPIYHLEAFVVCFPSGFSTRQKLGLPLAEIHAPVPGYQAKLERSMDRFFARLESGRAVRRSNWTVTTDDRLFCEAGTHLREDDRTVKKTNEETLDVHAEDLDDDLARQRTEMVIENCRLRSERQSLFRLPRSGALVFSFKTYLDRLEEVKREGSGPALAAAVEGLQKGNVPEMHFYKRGVVWGDKVLEFLRE